MRFSGCICVAHIICVQILGNPRIDPNCCAYRKYCRMSWVSVCALESVCVSACAHSCHTQRSNIYYSRKTSRSKNNILQNDCKTCLGNHFSLYRQNKRMRNKSRNTHTQTNIWLATPHPLACAYEVSSMKWSAVVGAAADVADASHRCHHTHKIQICMDFAKKRVIEAPPEHMFWTLAS